MPKIYITYSFLDSSRDELQKISDQLAAKFHPKNITISSTSKIADISGLTKLVLEHDIFRVLMGTRFATLVDEDGKSPLHSVYDYLYVEIVTALEKPSMRFFIVLTDGVAMPEKDFFPEALQRIISRDVVELYNPKTKQNEIAKLVRRVSDKATRIHSSEIRPTTKKTSRKTDIVEDILETSRGWSMPLRILDSCFWTVLILVTVFIFSMCYLLLQYRPT